jgi:chemotaxis protein methyltransferase CheR
MGDRELAGFATLFERHTGIRYRPEKRGLLVSRLVGRLRARGLADFASYLKLLENPTERAELMRLIDVLTTHETFFWREPSHFEFLEDWLDALPGRPQKLRAWSAASSTGEEGYTLAMTLAGKLPLGSFEVVGTDVSPGVVQTANQGLYPLGRAQHIPDAAKQRWCRKGAGEYDGTFLIARELRAHVKFSVANLMVPQPTLGKFHVAFLRNVLIYFRPDQQRNVVRNVVDRLIPGGLLIVGHSESATNAHPKLQVVVPSVYRLGE